MRQVLPSSGELGFPYMRDEYAVSHDGMKMFGVLDLETAFEGCRFSIGIRNANDKSMRLAMTVGYRVFVCDNMAFQGDFSPVLAKHTKNFSLINAVSVGELFAAAGYCRTRAYVNVEKFERELLSAARQWREKNLAPVGS